MSDIEISFILNRYEIDYLKGIIGSPWRSLALQNLFKPLKTNESLDSVLDGLIEKGFIQIKDDKEIVDTIVIRLLKQLVNATDVTITNEMTVAYTSVGIINISPDLYQDDTWHIQLKGTL